MSEGRVSIRNLAYQFLKDNPDEAYTSKEIANWLLKHHPNECKQKKINSSKNYTDDEFKQQLTSEIGNPLISKEGINTTDDSPQKYYFSEKTDEVGVLVTEKVVKLPTGKSAIAEHDLYPMIKKFLKSEFNVKAMRIDEKSSSNKRGRHGNHWLFPDIVGREDLTIDMENIVKSAVKEHGGKMFRTWSIEVKMLLKMSNLRQSFFQAVSNSSWANLGYLATSEIADEKDVMDEVRMLSSLHGIGLIHIDIHNPSNSRIVIPAKERPDIDWKTCDRIVNCNSDFRVFIERIVTFLRTSDVSRS